MKIAAMLQVLLVWYSYHFSVIAGDGERFSRLDVEDGLSHKTVYAIHQDRRGYMWFATENGLNRYDGVRFRSYFHQADDRESLSDDNINSIVEDEAGNLWLGSWGGGLNRFDPRTEKAVHYRYDPDDPTTISSNYVQCIVEGRNGVLWIGTRDGGLNRLDRKTGEVIRYQPQPNDPYSLNHFRVWSAYEEGDGTVWVGTDQGLSVMDPRTGHFKRLEGDPEAPFDLRNASIRCMLPGVRDMLWLGTAFGVARLDLNTRKVVYFPTSTSWGMGLSEILVNVLYETPDGHLWVGSLYEGLKRLDVNTGDVSEFQNDPRNPYSLGGNDVRSAYMDRSNNLWIGTRGNGLSRLDLKPPKFRLYVSKENQQASIPYGHVRAISGDPMGNIWVGMFSEGLTRIDRHRQKFDHFQHDPENTRSLSNNRVTALAVDTNGQLAVGTNNGLNFYDEETNAFKRVYHNPKTTNSMVNNRIMTLVYDRGGRLWIGTQKGLSVKDGENYTNYIHDPDVPGSLGGGRIYCLYEDRKGDLWVGMGHNGLFRFDAAEQTFKAFHTAAGAPAGLRNSSVLTLYDSEDLLWIGTMGGGLISMDHQGNNFKAYSRDEGLLNNVVHGILPGIGNDLWLSTNKGLCRFDFEEETFRCYGVFDGLQSTQFSLGSYYRARDGELFFGGVEGLNAFYPEEVKDHYFIPMVVISSFKVDDVEMHQYLPDNTEVVLEPPEQSISFEFASLDYTRPAKNQYAYRMEGLDSDWIYSATKPFARYHNLEPGSYVFRVKGSSHDGTWNPYGTSLKVTITSSFFKTWFYYIVYGAAGIIILLSLFSFLKYRELNNAKLRALERSERLAVEANRTKSAFLAHVSHELRTPLNAIIGFTELIDEDLAEYHPDHFRPGQCQEDLAKIKSSAYLQLAQVNNLLELTKLESGKSELYLETFNVHTMVNGVLHHIEPMLRKTANQLEVRFVPENIGEMTADFMKVQGILINLLSNANKFTKQGKITLSVSRSRHGSEQQICFQVTDTGIGMSDEQIGIIFNGFSLSDASSDHQMTGLGLYITRHFSRMMGGDVGVESQVSRGSTFSVRLPAVVKNTK